ncbi:MFS transporter [Mesomycoplasma conjunctivae]|uniref:MFS transporter n=1 Tax=Mesomycoplasma conjunctivae TaxID=45361 RepID=UPI003DA5BBD2
MTTFKHNFYKYTTSLSISLIGSEAFKFASSLYIYKITGDFWLVSILYLLIQLPSIIVYFFSQLIVNRTKKIKDKTILLFCDLISAFVLAGSVLLFFILQNNFSFSIILIVVSSTVGFIHSFRFIYIKNIVYYIAKNNEQLKKINIATSLATAIGFVISPILSFFVYKYFDFYYMIIFNILTYLTSGFLYFWIKMSSEKTVFVANKTINNDQKTYKFKHNWLFILSCSLIIGIILYPRTSGLPQMFKLFPQYSVQEWGFYLSIIFSSVSLFASLLQFWISKLKNISISWLLALMSLSSFIWVLSLILVKKDIINLIIFVIIISVRQFLFSLFISLFYTVSFQLFDKENFHKQNGISLTIRIITSSLIIIFLTYLATIAPIYAFIAYSILLLLLSMTAIIFNPHKNYGKMLKVFKNKGKS